MKRNRRFFPLSFTSHLAEKFRRKWDELRSVGIIPLLIVVVSLTFTVNLYVGKLALSSFNYVRWGGICLVLFLFVLLSFLLDLSASFRELNNFTDDKGKILDVRTLWRKVYTNPINGLFLMTVMTFGVTSAQSLTEYYRVNATTWYDADLWILERPLFAFLKGSVIDVPIFWDRVYGVYWAYILLIYCYLFRQKYVYDLTLVAIAVVLAYFLTRFIGCQYPTAGPMFYRPEHFNLEGTVSDYERKLLISYMRGNIEQSGFIPGTMAMPSLHVGMSFLASWFFIRHVKWALWPCIISVLLTWTSTIVLGWHYALDGFGGVVVVFFSVQIGRALLVFMRFNPKESRARSPNPNR